MTIRILLAVLLLCSQAWAGAPSDTMPSSALFATQAGAKTVAVTARGSTANITDCGTLSTADRKYVLQNNVTSTGTCFTAGASNITIDLNGKTVTYGTGDNTATLAADNYNPIAVGLNTAGYANVHIFNGSIIEGAGTCNPCTVRTLNEDNGTYTCTAGNNSGYGCNPIYGWEGDGTTVAGLTITHKADDQSAIALHWGNNASIHDNTITYTGDVLLNRYHPKGAIYNDRGTGGTFYNNEIVDALHGGIHAGTNGTVYGNVVGVKSQGTNGYGISTAGTNATTRAAIYDNRIAARGIHVNCIWPDKYIDVYNNYIDMQADQYASAEGWNGVNGFRRVWGSGNGISIHNNYVTGTTWGSNHATGLTIGTDVATDVIDIYENLFVVTSHDGTAKATGVEIGANPQGCSWSETKCIADGANVFGSEHITFRDNTIKSNLYGLMVGPQYGAAFGYPAFSANRIIKFGSYSYKTVYDEAAPLTSTLILCSNNSFEGGASASDINFASPLYSYTKDVLTAGPECGDEPTPGGSGSGMVLAPGGGEMHSFPGGAGMRALGQ